MLGSARSAAGRARRGVRRQPRGADRRGNRNSGPAAHVRGPDFERSVLRRARDDRPYRAGPGPAREPAHRESAVPVLGPAALLRSAGLLSAAPGHRVVVFINGHRWRGAAAGSRSSRTTRSCSSSAPTSSLTRATTSPLAAESRPRPPAPTGAIFPVDAGSRRDDQATRAAGVGAGSRVRGPSAALLAGVRRRGWGTAPVQGHSYLQSLVPWIVLLLAFAAGLFLRAIGRAFAVTVRFPATPFRSRDSGCCARRCLFAIYCAQESLEGLLATGHPAAVAGIFGYGGWWAIPASAAVGLVLAASFHGARWVLNEVALRQRPASIATPRRPASVISPARSSLLRWRRSPRAGQAAVPRAHAAARVASTLSATESVQARRQRRETQPAVGASAARHDLVLTAALLAPAVASPTPGSARPCHSRASSSSTAWRSRPRRPG